MSNKRCLILLGKTGTGKSATANTLLGTYRFEEGTDLMPEGKTVVYNTMDYNGYSWRIFETPAHVDVSKDEHEQMQWSLRSAETIMQICKEGNDVITAFLLVLNSQDRYTAEDRKTIEAYETIYGEDFLNRHCIIVFTKVDLLEIPADDWVKHQAGPFLDLYNKCDQRTVFVCNKFYREEEEDIEDRRQLSKAIIMKEVAQLEAKYPSCYSYYDYMSHAIDRYRLVLKYELESIVASFNESLSVIKNKRNRLNNKADLDNWLKDIAVLRFTIQEKDKNTGILKTQLDMLEREEESVHFTNSYCIIL